MMCADISVCPLTISNFQLFLDDLEGLINAKVWNKESDIESVVGAFWMTYDEYNDAVEAVQYHLQGKVVGVFVGSSGNLNEKRKIDLK